MTYSPRSQQHSKIATCYRGTQRMKSLGLPAVIPKIFKGLKPKGFLCTYISALFPVPSQTTSVWLRHLFHEDIPCWLEGTKIRKIQNSAITGTLF